VAAAWQVLFPVTEPAPAPVKPATPGAFAVQRGRPRDSEEIAALITRLHKNNKPLNRSDIMEAFGEKAFLLLQQDNHLVGVIGWQVENLVSRTTDLYLDPGIPTADAIPVLMKEMERASKDLQCEASLVFVPPDMARQEVLWKGLGYAPRTASGLGVQAWQEAAAESQPNGSILLFKQLRHDRILRPI
jgi:dephospho-CoA kinase